MQRVFKTGDLTVDVNRQIVQVANNAVQLTAMEYGNIGWLTKSEARIATTRHCTCYRQRSARSAGNWMLMWRRRAT